MSKAVAVVGLAACLVLAGCSTPETGEPLPAGATSATGGPPSSGSKPTADLPPRPKDIALSGVDPCKLFGKPQLDQMKVTRARNLVQDKDTWKGAPLCALDGADGQVFFSYTAWLITTEGVESWLGGKRNVDAKPVTVEGFPAATYQLKGTSTFHCWTSVGVADGQQLAVEFAPVTRRAFTQEQMCAMSEQAATFALQTLKTLK